MIDMKGWNKEYYTEFSPTPEEIEHQDKLVRKALQLITQGPDFFKKAQTTLLEAGKVKHWDERIYEFDHTLRVIDVFLIRSEKHLQSKFTKERYDAWLVKKQIAIDATMKRAGDALND